MLDQWKNWFGQEGQPVGTSAQLSLVSLEYTQDVLARATRSFNQSEVLGAGNYGAVYRGTMPDGSEVAIKLLEVDDNAGQDSGFADEVKCLSKFRHPNLVTLMGWGKAPGRRYIVYELLPGGDVSRRLKRASRNEEPFDWQERLSVARDSASGLSHMHNATPKAFHRDIKSANILLDRNGTAKMADFGLSIVDKTRGPRGNAVTVENISGTPGYACPHYIKTGRITEQTEVFAFGMVTLEMMMNLAPARMGQNGTILYPVFQTLMPQVPGVKERALANLDQTTQWPPELASELVDLALICTNIEEARRYDFIRTLQTLRPMCDRYFDEPGSRTPGSRRSQREFAPSPTSAAGYPGGAAPPGDMATAPQLGLPPGTPGNVTQPQMGIPGPGGSPSNAAQVTRPQMGGPLPAAAAAGAAAGLIVAESRGASAKAAVNPRTGAANQVNVASDPFLLKAAGPGPGAKNELVEVVLDCIFSNGLDVEAMPPKHKCLTLKVGENGPPWAVGRQQQPQYFARLVPDEALRSCISRSHIELAWQAPKLLLKKTSPNAVFADGVPAGPSFIPLSQGAEICFHPASPAPTPPPPFLKFIVHLRDAAAISALGPTALPTRPDVPVPDSVVREMQAKVEQQQRQQARERTHGPDGMPLATTPIAAASVVDAQGDNFVFVGADRNGDGIPDALEKSPRNLVIYCRTALAAGGGDRDLSSLPQEARTIRVPQEGRLSVGRQHQLGFFEALLGADSIYLTFISRLHFELIPGVGEVLELVNHSANPLVVGTQQLQKGQKVVLPPSTSIDFISKSVAGASAPQVYLRLMSLDEGQIPSQARLAQPSLVPVSAKETPALPSMRETPAPSLREMKGGEAAPFFLELQGTALKPEFLAESSSKRLMGTYAGLTVGRNHQAQLLLSAVKQEVVQYLSRDHFKIYPGESGQFLFTPLSANPMWRVRAREQTAAEKGLPLALEPGDAIALFTGASDCTAEGPGNQGSLYFRFGDVWTASSDMGADPMGTVIARPAPAPVREPPREMPRELPRERQLEPGTGNFDAYGRPIGAPSSSSYSDRQHCEAVERQTPAPKAMRNAPTMRAPRTLPDNELRPPVDLSPGVYRAQESQDELMQAEALGSLDMDVSTPNANDAFAKSGFHYGR